MTSVSTPISALKSLPQQPQKAPTNHSTLRDVKDWVRESAVFAWQFVWNPKTLGTPFICSPFVANEILKYVNATDKDPARQYLEVGAGTGAMTHHLVKRLRPVDTLHLVEIDQKLCDVLKSKYGNLPNVFIHHQAVQDWEPLTTHKFDAIITTVPLNSLPSAEVLTNIFNAFIRLIKPEGNLSSVEYIGTSTACKTFYFGEAKRNFDSIFAVKNAFFKKYSFERPIVLANLPPARVTHCRISTQPRT